MLPNVTRPEEFNRVLIYLADANGELSQDALMNALGSATYQGSLPDHSETISAAALVGFIVLRAGRLRLSELGSRFLAFNQDNIYELAPGQAQFLYSNLIRVEPYAPVVRSLFALFRSRGRQPGFTLNLANTNLSPDHIRLLSILRRLGAIEISAGVAVVTKEYEPHVSMTRARRRLSAEELEDLLSRQKSRGSAAERIVVEIERERLRNAGYPLEAASVRLISDTDIAAGYDIESFDGGSLALEPDRFIEVKSTSTDEGIFFWSENERATAEELGDRYWICHFRGFQTETCTTYSSVWICDPASKANSGQLALTCSQYKVSFDVENIDTMGVKLGVRSQPI